MGISGHKGAGGRRVMCERIGFDRPVFVEYSPRGSGGRLCPLFSQMKKSRRRKAAQPPHERLLLNDTKTPGFLAPGGDFNPGPETKLDRSELLCNKVLLKYKGDRESF